MPFFWEQKSLGDIQIVKSLQADRPAFDKHFEKLFNEYCKHDTGDISEILALNLVRNNPGKKEMELA